MDNQAVLSLLDTLESEAKTTKVITLGTIEYVSVVPLSAIKELRSKYEKPGA